VVVGAVATVATTVEDPGSADVEVTVALVELQGILPGPP
jgi:hypothetical protein